MGRNIEHLIGIAVKSEGTPEYIPRSFSSLQNPLVFDIETFFHSLAEELPFTANYSVLRAEEEEYALGLFQWLANQLLDRTTPSEHAPLLIVLLVSSCLGRGSCELWKELASLGHLQHHRLNELEELLCSRKIATEYLRLDAVAESFEFAAVNQDWKIVDRFLPHLSDYLIDAPTSSAAQALSIFSSAVLTRALNAIQDVIKLVIIIESLERVGLFSTLNAAVDSTNWSLKFVALRLSLERDKIISNRSCDELYIQLISQAAANEREWEKWVQVFNPYPSRYPTLQKSMGYALCTMGPDAVNEYFKPIHLSTADRRTDLIDVFKVVEQHHCKDQRQLIWSAAFQKWKVWNFDEQIGTKVFNIRTSSLDPAVIQYYRECQDEAGRDKSEADLRSTFIRLQFKWYEDISAYISMVNRHISHYQPFAHVRYGQIPDGNWFEGEHIYHPEWIPKTAYWEINHRMS